MAGGAPRGSRRRRVERLEGLTIDAVLVAAAALVSEDAVQEWLFAHPQALYHGLAIIHVIACPALLVAIVAGYGHAGRIEEIQRPGSGPLGWAVAFLFGGSFVIPGVLALTIDVVMWEAMVAMFAPIVLIPLWLLSLVVAERRGWIAPARVGERKAWWKVQALALLTWAYLLWLETMLLFAAGSPGPLSQVGIPAGVLIDYLPIRVALYYVRDSARWERYTIAASVLHLLYRIAAASGG